MSVIPPTPWGEAEIRGPVHLFRERLMLRMLLPMMSQGGRVLDAGCGSGSLAMDLCKAGFRVDAVEFSSAFSEMVRHKMSRYGSESRMTIQRASVTELPFDDGEFDGLVCGEVLEHVTENQGGDSAALREFNRVLKPGAPCVATVPLNPKLWDHSDEWAGHVKRYRREEFVSLFSDHGFDVEDVRTWGFPIGRIYHRTLFAPWIQSTADMDVVRRESRLDSKAVGNRRLVAIAAGIFRIDELFSRFDWGRGVAVSARRSPRSQG